MRTTLSYSAARRLLIAAGVLLVAGLAGSMWARGVDEVEVVATLFFAPVFLALMLGGVAGGIAMGVAAGLGYLALRWPAVQLVGWEPLSGQVWARGLGYVLFGAAGGWAVGQLRAALDKLALRDDIDDETGLHNARSFLEAVDTELSRGRRYATVFSLVTAEAAAVRVDGGRRREAALLRELGRRLTEGVRSSDHLAHTRLDGHHLFGVVLPETGPEGARTVAANLGRHLAEVLGEEAVCRTVTYPEDESGISEVLERFRLADQASRPVAG